MLTSASSQPGPHVDCRRRRSPLGPAQSGAPRTCLAGKWAAGLAAHAGPQRHLMHTAAVGACAAADAAAAVAVVAA
eukprot:scaffold75275_cov19-Tisochrysis_lutea.AAC.1